MRKYGGGDQGETTLASGIRVFKDDERLEVCGTIDEVSSLLGLARSILGEDDEISSQLLKIQEHLFILGSQISSIDSKKPKLRIDKKNLSFLEELIEAYEGRLPRIDGFIYPGGVEAAAIIHLARSIARRAERRAVALSRRFDLDPMILAYLNRLSTALFILARYLNLREGVEERVWRSS